MKLKARIQTRRWRIATPDEERDYAAVENGREVDVFRGKMSRGEALLRPDSSVVVMVAIFVPSIVYIALTLWLETGGGLGARLGYDLGMVVLLPIVLIVFVFGLLKALPWLLKPFGGLLSGWDWWVRQHMVMGESMTLPPDGHIEETHETPIEIDIDTTSEVPSLSWRTVGGERLVHERFKPVRTNKQPLPEGAALKVDLEGSVSLSEASRPAFDITRSSEREDVLFVACRSKAPGKEASQVVFACPRPAWMGDARFSALPVMERVGIELDDEASTHLLAQISELSEAMGRPIPALVQHTMPVQVSVAVER